MESQTIGRYSVKSRFAISSKSLFRRYWRWLWVIVFLGSTNFSIRDADAIYESPLTLYVIHRPISIVLISLPLLFFILKRPGVSLCGIPGVLVIFSLLRIASSFWSAFALWTLYRSIEYLMVVVLTAYTVSSLRDLRDLREWMNWIWGFLGVLVASAYVGIVFFPQEALFRIPNATLPVKLGGVLPRINSNGLAQMGGILALVGLVRLLGERKSKKWLPLIIWGIATMILAQSRAAMAGFCAGVLIILILYRRIGVLYVLGIVLLSSILIMPELWKFFWQFYLRGQSPEMFIGLSGRYYWWGLTWNYIIKESVFLGHGAFAGGRLFAPIYLGYISLTGIDNAWLELMVDIGLVGLLLFLVPIIWSWRVLLSKAHKGNAIVRTLSIECLAILTLGIVYSFFGSSITLHNAFFYFVLVGCAEFLRRWGNKKYS